MNVSWCDFNNLHVQAIANNIPSSVTQLNISGYRQNLTMEGEESIDFSFMYLCKYVFLFHAKIIYAFLCFRRQSYSKKVSEPHKPRFEVSSWFGKIIVDQLPNSKQQEVNIQ